MKDQGEDPGWRLLVIVWLYELFSDQRWEVNSHSLKMWKSACGNGQEDWTDGALENCGPAGSYLLLKLHITCLLNPTDHWHINLSVFQNILDLRPVFAMGRMKLD